MSSSYQNIRGKGLDYIIYAEILADNANVQRMLIFQKQFDELKISISVRIYGLSKNSFTSKCVYVHVFILYTSLWTST